MLDTQGVYRQKLDEVQQKLSFTAARGGLNAPVFSKLLLGAQGAFMQRDASGEPSAAPAAYAPIVRRAAQTYGLDEALIRAVIQTESSYDQNAVSGAGAEGLMQLMPRTAASLGVTNSFDPAQNIMAGTRYLKEQLDRFGDLRLALAAYNTGPGRVNSYNITNADDPSQYERLSEGVRGYVSKVLSHYGASNGRTSL